MGESTHKRKSYKKGNKKYILAIAKAMLFSLFIFSSVMLITQILKAKQEYDAFLNLADIVSVTEPSLSVNKSDNNELAYTEMQKQILPQYEKIYEMNSDFIGWLSVPNTSIDYPVMFTPNAPEYYIRRAFDKTRSQSGTPFIGQNGDTDGDFFIIYGHNMKNDTMFGMLDKYTDKKFWEENKTIYFNTLYEYRQYEVFAAVKTTVLHTDEAGVRYYNYAGKLSEAEYKELTDWLMENSVYDTDICPVYGEQILVLSTCSYHTDNGRFIVAARQIR